MAMAEKEKFILYVDDDEEDREFLSEALVSVSPDVKVKLAENGLQALEFLEAIKSSRLPCLIVLDLNMPFLNGMETCHRIKTDDVLQSIPVMIFSSSEKPMDKNDFSEMGIEYFTKPNHVEQIRDIAGHMVSVCCKC